MGELEAVWRSHMEKVAKLPQYVWNRLCLCVGGAILAPDLRADAIQSCCVSGGYLHKECFDAFQKEPWCWAVGDVKANVDRLMAKITDDPLTVQIQRLLQRGMPRAQVEAALRLLADVPCSVTLIEEAHSGSAWIMRQHPQLQESALLSRSMLHQLRPCIGPSVLERQVPSLDERIAAMRRKQPWRVRVQHLLFGQLATQATSGRGMTQAAAMAATQNALRSAPRVLASMDLEQRAELQRHRQRWVQERLGAINAQVDDLELCRSLLLQEADRHHDQDGVKKPHRQHEVQ
jgi:hypothetical protein